MAEWLNKAKCGLTVKNAVPTAPVRRKLQRGSRGSQRCRERCFSMDEQRHGSCSGPPNFQTTGDFGKRTCWRQSPCVRFEAIAARFETPCRGFHACVGDCCACVRRQGSTQSLAEGEGSNAPFWDSEQDSRKRLRLEPARKTCHE